MGVEEITMCCASTYGQNTVEAYKYNPLKGTSSFNQAKHVCDHLTTTPNSYKLCGGADVLQMVNTHKNGAHTNAAKKMTSYSQDTTYGLNFIAAAGDYEFWTNI